MAYGLQDEDEPKPNKMPKPVADLPKFEPIEFTVQVLSDTENELSGQYEATISRKGLRLDAEGETIERFPIGTNTVSEGRSTIRLEIGKRDVTVRLRGKKLNTELLAQDIANLLTGNRFKMRSRDYDTDNPAVDEVPPWLKAIAFLPLLMVFVGGAIGGGLGGGAAGINSWIARQASWPLPIRILAMFGMTALAVALYMFAVTAIFGVQRK